MIFLSKHTKKINQLARHLGSVLVSVVIAVSVFAPFAPLAYADVNAGVAAALARATVAADRAVAEAQAAKAEAAKPGSTVASVEPLAQKATASAAEAVALIGDATRLSGALPNNDPNKADSQQAAIRARDTGPGAKAYPISGDMSQLLDDKARQLRDKAALEAQQAQAASASRSAVQTNQSTNATSNAGSTDKRKYAKHPLEMCGVITGTLSMCVAGIFYVFFVDLTSPIAYLSGAVFDAFAGLSLQSGTYASAVIAKGWVIARDIANMAFVFILIYIAIMLILNLEGVGAARQIAGVIAVALLINFSFFFSRVIIDGSNILAHAFYDNIVAAPGPASESILVSGTKLVGSAVGGASGTNVDIKSISEKVMAGINPQDLIGNPTFQAMITGSASGVTSFFDNLAILLTLFFIFGIINIILAFVFLTAAFQFLARIVSLWFAIILSPLAFVSFILPPAKKVWTAWLSLIINNAFYAPAFMFVIYITIKMLDNGLLSTDIASFLAGSGAQGVGQASGGAPGIMGFLNRIVGVIMRLSVVVGLLVAALKVGSYMGAQGANIAQKWGGKLAIGGNAAAVGWAARNTAGWAGNALARTGVVKDFSSGKYGSGGILLGRTLEMGGNKLASSSFDIRASGLPEMNAGGKAQSGGYKKAVEDRVKALEHDEHERHDTPEDKLRKKALIEQELGYAAQKEAIESQTALQRVEEREAADRQLTSATENFTAAEREVALALQFGTEQQKEAARARKAIAAEEVETARLGISNSRKSKAERLKDLDKKVSDALGKEDSERKKTTAEALQSANIRNLWGFSTRATDRAAYNIVHGESKEKKLAKAVQAFGLEAPPPAAAPTAAVPAATPPPPADGGAGGGGHH